MDFSRLDQNEKLAVYGAAASIIGPLIATAGFGLVGVGWLTLLLALAMLAIVFLPQLSPQTTLPGSKGSLMLIVGGIAAIGALLSLLTGLGVLGLLGVSPVFVVGWLIGVAGGLLMGWAGWQEFQSEGGKFQLGSAAPSRSSTPSTTESTQTTASTTASTTTASTTTDAPPPASGTTSDRDPAADQPSTSGPVDGRRSSEDRPPA